VSRTSVSKIILQSDVKLKIYMEGAKEGNIITLEEAQ